MNNDDCSTFRLVVMLVRIGVSSERKWVRSLVAACNDNTLNIMGVESSL